MKKTLVAIVSKRGPRFPAVGETMNKSAKRESENHGLRPWVSIVMGSDSDLEKMSEAARVLDELDVNYEIQVLSAHRTPKETLAYAQHAKTRGLKVIIAGAGGAAALPGTIAALTTLPVIGVPIKSKSMDGLDSLLSIAQMPPGVPVATVGIDGARNAGIIAAEIIGTQDPKVSKSIEKHKLHQRQGALNKNSKLQKIGWKKYLKENKQSFSANK